MFTVKSITGKIHDLGYGGYPYKVVVMVEISVKDYNKMCPIWAPAKSTIFGRQPAKRDLSSLVIDVNNHVYRINKNIPAHNPSIDSLGGSRSKNGIKTMEFVYFFKDHERAEALGFDLLKLKNGDVLPRYGQYISINHELAEPEHTATNDFGRNTEWGA